MSDINFYEILKYLIPQIGIIVLVYLFLENWLKRDNLYQIRKRKDEFNQLILPNQIHAFERMVLFLERISPNNIVPRLNQQDLTAKEFQYIMTKDIADEFDHNLSQQLYIPNKTWGMIILAKDQMIQSIIHATGTLPDSAKAKDLAIKLLSDVVMNDKNVGTSAVIEQLKKDLFTMIN
jgi:hypothetical protein